MIISRLQNTTKTRLRQHRRAGASGGGWISFELALKGQQRTLESYLSYGMLQEQYPISFATIATTALLQDHHWRQEAAVSLKPSTTTMKTLRYHPHPVLTPCITTPCRQMAVWQANKWKNALTSLNDKVLYIHNLRSSFRALVVKEAVAMQKFAGPHATRADV